jgi:hypothetical protein
VPSNDQEQVCGCCGVGKPNKPLELLKLIVEKAEAKKAEAEKPKEKS